jgi:hypothetical protein
MKSHTTARFREAYANLPEPIKRQARTAYGRWGEESEADYDFHLEMERFHPLS